LTAGATPGHIFSLVPPPEANTLGAILYADPSRPRVSEEMWLGLVRAVAGGDQAALHSLYEHTHRIVFTLVLRITLNRETAEEVTIDVFHEVWQRASAYDPANGSVAGWIMNLARSRAIDRLRFEQPEKRVDRSDAAMLRNALAAVTPEERQAIESAFFGGVTYAEVASRLAQPLGTVKTRIRTGMYKLRHVLAGEAQS